MRMQGACIIKWEELPDCTFFGDLFGVLQKKAYLCRRNRFMRFVHTTVINSLNLGNNNMDDYPAEKSRESFSRKLRD